jgi:NAD(P)-dependent dehydrogenase (short-subunit alcohol dehydrogenase family)
VNVPIPINCLIQYNEETGGKILLLPIDLAKHSDIDSIIPTIEKAGFPPVDVLVNNVCRSLLLPDHDSRGTSVGGRSSWRGKSWRH